ncbi:MAG: type III secretion system inner rod subunit SctI [bacterium]
MSLPISSIPVKIPSEAISPEVTQQLPKSNFHQLMEKVANVEPTSLSSEDTLLSQKVEQSSRNEMIEGVGKVAIDLNNSYQRLDEINRLLFSGTRTFMPQELLALQAEVYRLSQEIELVSKAVGKTADGLKTIMQTQV